MDENIFRSTCPISSSLDLFGDKWTLLIVRDLLYHGTRTFKDFYQSEENISSARLSERLKKLEGLQALTKENHPTNKKVYIYKLTQKGKDLAPAIIDLITWGNKYLNHHISDESKKFAANLKENREIVLKELMK
ncbi:helix-turn-helix domain-containing protein [uncultured Winogradskyella sp.]|uniref:winged helix-turn-helix transcriptional regulator n=1 Tax=uncultured Winogradskyella sp. TaxID=395353 RepID=UPI00260987A2|nr:helix-turn-helix domain-containing protein [uncultured Winogradskyella sp.]